MVSRMGEEPSEALAVGMQMQREAEMDVNGYSEDDDKGSYKGIQNDPKHPSCCWDVFDFAHFGRHSQNSMT